MTKDRLSDLRKIRAESGGELNDSTENLVSADEKCQTIQHFLEQMGAIKLEIQRIRNRIDILKKFHLQIEKCSQASVRKELEDKVEEESQLITTSAANIRASIKSVEDLFSQRNVTPAMQRMKEVQVNSLLTLLRETMQHYLDCLLNHRDKSIQLLNDMLDVTNEGGADAEKLLEEGKTAFFVNNLLMDSLDAKYSLQEIEDRHTEILNIEKSILELRNTFAGLALLVSQQGDKILSLEHYVSKTTKKVERAKKQIVVAKRKSDKVRWRKLILSTVCIVVIIIVLLLILVLM